MLRGIRDQTVRRQSIGASVGQLKRVVVVVRRRTFVVLVGWRRSVVLVGVAWHDELGVVELIDVQEVGVLVSLVWQIVSNVWFVGSNADY